MPKGRIIEHARKYVKKMPPAISGQGGDLQTFTVACRLVQGFNLSVENALPLLAEYNGRCVPPWTLPELQHKLTEADKQEGRCDEEREEAEDYAEVFCQIVEDAEGGWPETLSFSSFLFEYCGYSPLDLPWVGDDDAGSRIYKHAFFDAWNERYEELYGPRIGNWHKKQELLPEWRKETPEDDSAEVA